VPYKSVNQPNEELVSQPINQLSINQQ